MTPCRRRWPDVGHHIHKRQDRGAVPPVPAAHHGGAVRGPLHRRRPRRRLETLLEVLEQEAEDRRQRRIGQLRTASRLPPDKTWETFEHGRVPLALRQQLDELADGGFVDRGVNVLAFGLPGTGNTHALCAVGHRLLESGRSVLFAPGYRLVQDLLAAKRDLSLPRQLRKLDSYDFLLLDDLGYLPQGAEESEVLFTLIAERYERRSLGITSNLVFSQWEHIFANPMATAAAIDRAVHHSVILEFDVSSYRTGVAQLANPMAPSDGGGHRPRRTSLGHLGIRRLQLPHRSGPEAGSG